MERLDIRTHLFVLLIATLFWILFQGEMEIHCLVVLGAFYMFAAGYGKRIWNFVISYIVLVLLAYASIRIMGILYIVLNTFARAVPLMMVAAPILYANPSRMMGSFRRLHIPKKILVMFCILVRFFPVMKEEMMSIRDGIRARGIFPVWWRAARHPVMAYECFFVPLTVRCLKLSAELGASADLRGLDAPVSRSCIYNIGFTYKDILAAAGFGIGGVMIMSGVRMWLN